ncbi:hypothetical protein Q7P35_002523 [Cladosporium inversicolor]
MVLITTTTEITCSPAHLRKVLTTPKRTQFLDFPRIPEWTQGAIRSITPQAPNKPPKELVAGDKLTVQLEGMSFSPVVLENSAQQFKWRGAVPLLFYGDHFFRFEDSKTTPGATTFSHGEEFKGILVAPFGWFGLGAKTGTGFEKFNLGLKREAEREGGLEERK